MHPRKSRIAWFSTTEIVPRPFLSRPVLSRPVAISVAGLGVMSCDRHPRQPSGCPVLGHTLRRRIPTLLDLTRPKSGPLRHFPLRLQRWSRADMREPRDHDY
jgi:hypothetical protein